MLCFVSQTHSTLLLYRHCGYLHRSCCVLFICSLVHTLIRNVLHTLTRNVSHVAVYLRFDATIEFSVLSIFRHLVMRVLTTVLSARICG